ncbi:MAG TPA: hypothetical protein VGQ80_05015, partial [Acidimicrobiia bacterium]|nr:hypothetical protein [Acidimicrobiia bacterium]
MTPTRPRHGARLLVRHRPAVETLDLDGVALRLAHTPCGALRTTHDFPDRALAAVVAGTTG